MYKTPYEKLEEVVKNFEYANSNGYQDYVLCARKLNHLDFGHVLSTIYYVDDIGTPIGLIAVFMYHDHPYEVDTVRRTIRDAASFEGVFLPITYSLARGFFELFNHFDEVGEEPFDIDSWLYENEDEDYEDDKDSEADKIEDDDGTEDAEDERTTLLKYLITVAKKIFDKKDIPIRDN